MITIKGLNNNLIFIFKEGHYQDFRDCLIDKFTSNPGLFKGSPVIFKGPGLNSLKFDEMVLLQQLCLEHGLILNNIQTSITKTVSRDLMIHRNIRSGQRIHGEGSVIIWGDVHESAEISAGGDILVLGKLEGIAHAGFYGNLDSIIFAIHFSPGQIRIGPVISRNESNEPKGIYPEIAYLEGNQIIVKEYNSRDNLARLNII